MFSHVTWKRTSKPLLVAFCHTFRPMADATATTCLQTEQLRLENTCLRGSAKVSS